jgi:hypothetical protein
LKAKLTQTEKTLIQHADALELSRTGTGQLFLEKQLLEQQIKQLKQK